MQNMSITDTAGTLDDYTTAVSRNGDDVRFLLMLLYSCRVGRGCLIVSLPSSPFFRRYSGGGLLRWLVRGHFHIVSCHDVGLDGIWRDTSHTTIRQCRRQIDTSLRDSVKSCGDAISFLG